MTTHIMTGKAHAQSLDIDPFLTLIDEIQSQKINIHQEYHGTNYVPLVGLKILKKHLSDIIDRKTSQPISAEEFIIMQNEKQDIKNFVNNTVMFGIFSSDKSQLRLADAYRDILNKYEVLVDKLVDSPVLFQTYQPAFSRGMN